MPEQTDEDLLALAGRSEAAFMKIVRKTAGSDFPPSIFSAVQEQLGLALQASKAPIDILVVDQTEKTPTAN